MKTEKWRGNGISAGYPVQDKLLLAHGTAKTHIAYTYYKLGIIPLPPQQPMDMVGGRGRTEQTPNEAPDYCLQQSAREESYECEATSI